MGIKFGQVSMLALLQALALQAVAGPAWAEPEKPAPAKANQQVAQADTDAGGEEIVITARRRSELLQNVPVAVSAFSGKELQQKGISKIEDLPRIAPGFVVQTGTYGPAALTPSLRSQRQRLNNLAFDPSVGIYFAEVVEQRGHGLNSSMYDLSNVQVVKGPIGTLFGRNATGGAILLAPTPPGDQFGGYIQGSFGSYSLHEFEGAVDLPVSDKLQIRLSGHSRDRDGYTESLNSGIDYDNDHSWGLRGSVRFTPTERFKNTLVYDTVKDRSSTAATKLTNVFPGSLGVGTAAGLSVTEFNNLNAELARLNAADFHTTGITLASPGVDIASTLVSNISELNINDAINFKNIVGFRYLNSYVNNDFDGSSIEVIRTFDKINSRQLSDEIQMLGTLLDDDLTYIIGGYFFDERGAETQITNTRGTDSLTTGYIKNKSQAAFAQATYKLPFYRKVSITAGIRWTNDERSVDMTAQRLGACLLTISDTSTTGLNPCRKYAETAFEKVTDNFSIDWKVTDDVLLYFASRRGYRAGGFNWTGKKPSEFNPFAPEVVRDYEAGIKASYNVGSAAARTNLAAYWQDYNNIQRNLTTFPIGANGQAFTQSTIINAAKATIKGVEIEQYIRPIDILEINLSYAYSQPQYNKFLVPTGAGGSLQNFVNSKFAGAPEHMVSASARLELPMKEEHGKLFFQISGAWQSQTVMNDVDSFDPIRQITIPTSKLKAYGTLDLRLDWQDVFQKSIDLSLWVRNLTDQEYYTAGTEIGVFGSTAQLLGTPRVIGATARYSF